MAKKKKHRDPPEVFRTCSVCEKILSGAALKKCKACHFWTHVACCTATGVCHICAAARTERE